MNIAHITLLHGYNYGGMLQAYCTQKILKSHGHSVITLDYHPWKKYDLLRKLTFCNRFIYENAKKFIDRRAFSGVDEFDKFRIQNFTFSKPCQTSNQLSKACKSMDFVAVGSDQVWSNSWFTAPYFLDFDLPSNCKRVSLAACCGGPSDDQSFLDYLSKTITKFDAVSVRNDFTAKMVQKSTGRQPEVICDPTLACSIPTMPVSGIQGEFALVYVINRPKSLALASKVIEDLRRKTKMKIISVTPPESMGKEILSCDKIESEISPFQWAWLVQNASFVVTDSFHGAIFSAKYHRPMVILDSGFRSNNRLHAIAADLKIEDAILFPDSLIDVTARLSAETDWSQVDLKIESLAAGYHAFVTKNIDKSSI
jgi:Polysaccharide pyruvyl transferase